MRVLYVDDDRINILLFEETCRVAGGIEVSSALTGAEALELAAETRPEVLVIDLHLPDTTGDALLPELRRLPGLAAVPAFLCTADDPRLTATRASASGFTGCWGKPVDLHALIAELGRLRREEPPKP